jgi:hypothetical protein
MGINGQGQLDLQHIKAAYPEVLIGFWVSIHVTPHMVTNSFQEWGLPIWENFIPPARSGMGTPRMVMGIGVFAFP